VPVDFEVMLRHAVAPHARLAFEGFVVQARRVDEEAVVVQARRRIHTCEVAEAAAGFGHQAFERGVAEALAQRRGAFDFEEEHAAGGRRQRRTELLQQVAARHQAGRRVAAGFGHALLAERTRALDAAFNRGDQVPRANGLLQEIVGAEFEHFELLVRVRVAGEEHDRRMQEGFVRADHRREVRARQARHVQVHQHEVGRGAHHHVDHVGRIGGDDRFDARAVEHAFGEQRLRAVVFDDQHAEGRLIAAERRQRNGIRRHRVGRCDMRRRCVLRIGRRCVFAPAAPVILRRGFRALR